jgi:hypothetical protein
VGWNIPLNFITKLELLNYAHSSIVAFFSINIYSNFLKRFPPREGEFVRIDFNKVFGSHDSPNDKNRCLFFYLSHYFTSWWQVQLSANIGGLFWENCEDLKKFIIKYQIVKSLSFGFRDSNEDEGKPRNIISTEVIEEKRFNRHLQNYDAIPKFMLTENKDINVDDIKLEKDFKSELKNAKFFREIQ